MALSIASKPHPTVMSVVITAESREQVDACFEELVRSVGGVEGVRVFAVSIGDLRGSVNGPVR